MHRLSSIPTTDARAVFRIRRGIRPFVPCHVRVQ
jgi:hypothetical protein